MTDMWCSSRSRRAAGDGGSGDGLLSAPFHFGGIIKARSDIIWLIDVQIKVERVLGNLPHERDQAARHLLDIGHGAGLGMTIDVRAVDRTSDLPVRPGRRRSCDRVARSPAVVTTLLRHPPLLGS